MPALIGSPSKGKTMLLPTVLAMKTVAATTNENGVVHRPVFSSSTAGETSASGAASGSEASGVAASTVSAASLKHRIFGIKLSIS